MVKLARVSTLTLTSKLERIARFVLLILLIFLLRRQFCATSLAPDLHHPLLTGRAYPFQLWSPWAARKADAAGCRDQPRRQSIFKSIPGKAQRKDFPHGGGICLLCLQHIWWPESITGTFYIKRKKLLYVGCPGCRAPCPYHCVHKSPCLKLQQPAGRSSSRSTMHTFNNTTSSSNTLKVGMCAVVGRE